MGLRKVSGANCGQKKKKKVLHVPLTWIPLTWARLRISTNRGMIIPLFMLSFPLYGVGSWSFHLKKNLHSSCSMVFCLPDSLETTLQWGSSCISLPSLHSIHQKRLFPPPPSVASYPPALLGLNSNTLPGLMLDLADIAQSDSLGILGETPDF